MYVFHNVQRRIKFANRRIQYLTSVIATRNASKLDSSFNRQELYMLRTAVAAMGLLHAVRGVLEANGDELSEAIRVLRQQYNNASVTTAIPAVLDTPNNNQE